MSTLGASPTRDLQGGKPLFGGVGATWRCRNLFDRNTPQAAWGFRYVFFRGPFSPSQDAEKPLGHVILSEAKNLGSCKTKQLQRSFVACGSLG